MAKQPSFEESYGIPEGETSSLRGGANEDSWRVAKRLTQVVSAQKVVVDRYLAILASVPTRHLLLLERRGGQIVFAPTMADAFDSLLAEVRRGGRLTPDELFMFRTEFCQAKGTEGVYDPELDWLVFPTSYRSRRLERTVLHELGHALTMEGATARPGLLENLPPELEAHLRNPAYGHHSDPSTLNRRVFEVLADAYAYLLSGKVDLLPRPVVDELMLILGTVIEDAPQSRLDLENDLG